MLCKKLKYFTWLTYTRWLYENTTPITRGGSSLRCSGPWFCYHASRGGCTCDLRREGQPQALGSERRQELDALAPRCSGPSSLSSPFSRKATFWRTSLFSVQGQRTRLVTLSPRFQRDRLNWFNYNSFLWIFAGLSQFRWDSNSSVASGFFGRIWLEEEVRTGSVWCQNSSLTAHLASRPTSPLFWILFADENRPRRPSHAILVASRVNRAGLALFSPEDRKAHQYHVISHWGSWQTPSAFVAELPPCPPTKAQ